MAYTLVFDPSAEADLLSIERYVSVRSPSGAENVLRDIDEAIGIIMEFPLMSRLYQPDNVRTRITLKYKYRIVFQFDGATITIFQILHAKQNFTAIRSE